MPLLDPASTSCSRVKIFLSSPEKRHSPGNLAGVAEPDDALALVAELAHHPRGDGLDLEGVGGVQVVLVVDVDVAVERDSPLGLVGVDEALVGLGPVPVSPKETPNGHPDFVGVGRVEMVRNVWIPIPKKGYQVTYTVC